MSNRIYFQLLYLTSASVPGLAFSKCPAERKALTLAALKRLKMIRSVFAIFFLLNLTISFGQVNKHGYPCGGMDILDVGIHIKGFKAQHQSTISADFLRKGFTVALTDTSYKLLRFVVSYSRGNKVTEYQIKDSVVSEKNAIFLKEIQPGDFLSLECVNIERGGYESLTTTMWIVATN